MKKGGKNIPQPAPAAKPSGNFLTPKLAWILLALIILFFAVVRIRLLDLPLERDEGEYAYAGQLMLQGVPPYKLAYNMKLPGTYAIYALIMALFGQTASGIHLGLLFVNAATVLLMFALGKKIFNLAIGLVAAASYALLSTSPALLGQAAHATHFVIFFALIGVWLLWRAEEKGNLKRFFLSGLAFGFAFLMKQPGIFFCAFAGLWLLFSEFRRKPLDSKMLISRVGLLGAGMLLPFAATCLILWQAGVFEKFWFWTFTYARAYASVIPLNKAASNFIEASKVMLEPNEALWLLGIVGIPLMFCVEQTRKRAVWLIAFTLFSFVAVCPGFYFRQHYFILLAPAWCLFIGIAVNAAIELIEKFKLPRFAQFLPATAFALLMLWLISLHWQMFFRWPPVVIHRAAYGANPFVETVEVAKFIRENSTPDAKVAVLGSEPQIYFYAKRRSAAGYIYMYPMMEPQPFAHTMQEEMIKQIEAAQPEFLVFVSFPFSWAGSKDSDETIFKWFDQYKNRYESAGTVNYVSGDSSRQDDEKYFVEILRRKYLSR